MRDEGSAEEKFDSMKGERAEVTSNCDFILKNFQDHIRAVGGRFVIGVDSGNVSGNERVIRETIF